MDKMANLELAIGELHREVEALDDSELDIVTNSRRGQSAGWRATRSTISSCGPGS